MDNLEEELDALERILCGQKEPDSLDFRLLQRLTGNFSDDRRIGEGGCGEVYKGILPNGKVIAVKKLRKDHTIDQTMFLREVDSMIKVGHHNIVRFLGYCSEIKEKAVKYKDGKTVMAEEREKLLCFPYISNGSLDKYLTDELRGFEWNIRYQIVKGICDGLLHLHKEKGIVHMDLKPANVLLGDQMVPKITDFGVSRIDGKTQITSEERLFSRGYAAPEYIHTGERSWKSDIYSLGVIMIELVSGSMKIPNTTQVLRRWRHRWNKSSNQTPLWYLQVKKCLDLAVRCQEQDRINRPFIWDVVRELNELDRWDGQVIESSLEKIISSSDDMLRIEPLELHFTLAHDKKQISCSIELTNDTDYYMAFRIATTSLLPFSIQPDKGIAAPGSMCRTTIILPAQEMTRLKNHSGGVIVQSTRVDGNLTDVDITDVMFNDKGDNSQEKTGDGDKVVDEVNLTVLFDDLLHKEHQKDVTNLSAEMGSLGTSSQIISSSDDMLRIEPLELHFTLAHDKKQISCSIELTNDTDYYMAFRIATTSLLPFSIQPDKGIAAPGSMCRTTIILPAQGMARLKNHSGGFIVQSTRVDGNLKDVDITDVMFNDKGGNSQEKTGDGDKVVDEVNLTVLFDDLLHKEHQKDATNLSAEMGSLGTSSQVVQQCMELSQHQDYKDSRDMDVLERILDGRQSPTQLPLSLLGYITAGFSNDRMIGSGRSGGVYKGILGNKIVAVKRLLTSYTMDDILLHREIASMMTVEHKNTVRLLGYCYDTKEATGVEGKVIRAHMRESLLCLEYVNNGSLYTYVTDELRGLEWNTRYQIILGICEGLQHLHKEKHIIHMDLKLCNILLGDHMVPKITYFGLLRFKDKSQIMSSKLLGGHMVPKITDFDLLRFKDKSQIMSSKLHLLPGYCTPEYPQDGRMSAKSDIYSLGVIIIELVTGRSKRPNLKNVLRRWRHRWNKSAKYTPLWHQQVTKCLELAFRCMDKDPTQRPHIWDIIRELNESDTRATSESADQLTNSFLDDDMLGIEPLEIYFPVVELNTQQQSRSIQLTNDTDHYIAFMLWGPFTCSVQPGKGVVAPRSMCSVTITLEAPEEPGTGITHQDEFTVRSTKVDGDVTAADVSQDMFIEEEGEVVDKVSVTVILGT